MVRGGCLDQAWDCYVSMLLLVLYKPELQVILVLILFWTSNYLVLINLSCFDVWAHFHSVLSLLFVCLRICLFYRKQLVFNEICVLTDSLIPPPAWL